MRDAQFLLDPEEVPYEINMLLSQTSSLQPRRVELQEMYGHGLQYEKPHV